MIRLSGLGKETDARAVDILFRVFEPIKIEFRRSGTADVYFKSHEDAATAYSITAMRPDLVRRRIGNVSMHYDTGLGSPRSSSSGVRESGGAIEADDYRESFRYKKMLREGNHSSERFMGIPEDTAHVTEMTTTERDGRQGSITCIYYDKRLKIPGDLKATAGQKSRLPLCPTRVPDYTTDIAAPSCDFQCFGGKGPGSSRECYEYCVDVNRCKARGLGNDCAGEIDTCLEQLRVRGTGSSSWKEAEGCPY
jgi:hypothetical protein